MYRKLCLILATAATWGPGLASAQSRPAPLYSLPADGTWVQYEWELLTPDGMKQTGKLRISSVGHKQVQDVPHRWIEIKLSYDKPGQKKDRLRKLLVSELALKKGLPAKEVVVECYRQEGAEGPVFALRPAHWGDLLGMGFAGSEARLRETKAKESVRVPLGTFQARHMQTPDKNLRGALAYHGWLTGKVPFGWARFRIREGTGEATRILFTASAVTIGAGARSEVNESRAEKTP